MALSIRLRVHAFLFKSERLWKVTINSEGPVWAVRRMTQHEAVAQAAGMHFPNFGEFKVRAIGPDRFTIEAKVGKMTRGLGVASCIPA